jgi:hypothetical protein
MIDLTCSSKGCSSIATEVTTVSLKGLSHQFEMAKIVWFNRAFPVDGPLGVLKIS